MPHSGLSACFGEPPFPPPLGVADDDLYSPASCRGLGFDGTSSDAGASFDQRTETRDVEKTIANSRFIAQHVRNKDSFENVSWKGDITFLG